MALDLTINFSNASDILYITDDIYVYEINVNDLQPFFPDSTKYNIFLNELSNNRIYIYISELQLAAYQDIENYAPTIT